MTYSKTGLSCLNLVLTLFCLAIVSYTPISATAQEEKKETQGAPADVATLEDPGPVYTHMIFQWAKVTNFAENASQVIVGKLKLDMQKDPKLQKVATPEMFADLEQFFYELFISPETIKELAKLYAQYFTLDEMQDLLNFYQSPVGKKLIKVDAKLKLQTQQIGADLLKKHQRQYMEVIAKYIAPKEAGKNAPGESPAKQAPATQTPSNEEALPKQ